MRVHIQPEQPDSAVARALIAELDAILNPHYPPESRHGYSVEKLIQQGVAFFVVYLDKQPVGCGGVQIVGSEYAELKRMYVRPAFRGRGVGKQLLAHLETYASERGIWVLRLETGVHKKRPSACTRALASSASRRLALTLKIHGASAWKRYSASRALQPAPQLGAQYSDRLRP